MDDSSDDESFYITQSSTRRRSETTKIDDHWFDTSTLSDCAQLQDVETIKKAENAMGATSTDIFEGRLFNFTKYSSFRVIF